MQTSVKRMRWQWPAVMLVLLVLLLIVAATAWAIERRNLVARRALSQRITAIGGAVTYQHQYGDEDEYNPVRSAEPYPDVGWLRRVLFGDESAIRIQAVRFPNGVPVDREALILLRKLDEARHLLLAGSLADDGTLRELVGLENVEILNLTATNVTNDGLRSVAQFRNLRQLGANYLPISAEGLQHLRWLPEFEWVELYETSLTEEGVVHFQETRPSVRIDWSTAEDEPHRKGLAELEQSGFTIERRKRSSGQGIVYRISTPSQDFALGPFVPNWHGSEADLTVLPHIRHVRALGLAANISVEGAFTDKILEPVSQLESLQDLSLRENRITDRGLQKITLLRKLTSLDLSGTPIGDEAMQYLAQLQTLEDLRLDRTKVGDEGVSHLKSLPALRRLHLSHTRITTAAIDALGRLETLSELDVSGNSFSKEVYERLRGMLPECKIKWTER